MIEVNSLNGSIHGRFQPFHNGHLAYALATLAFVDTLYVGLTRVLTEPGIGGEIAPHRLKKESNPLSYFERSRVIHAALISAGVNENRFRIGPFPIEEPARIPEFWPLIYPCYTTIVDDWNRRKVLELEDLGYQVVVLEGVIPENSKVASGTEIRRLIRNNDPTWSNFVPEGAKKIIEEYRGSF
jgi:nicotinamide mononucleotide adenylyltransferase